ncbi:MAG: ATP-binding protein [Synergistaceae bacterium]|nr:ATP-binding protein [Synergistaceae bacterium]
MNEPSIAVIKLREGMIVISESLHRQRYKYLWDLLFERHPKGEFIKGKWEGMGAKKTDVPSDTLIREMLEAFPTVLLLDEFQTWFDGLKSDVANPAKAWAFNFIQILSEIAKERPDLLVLVISVRNGESDAYQQVHRVNPIAIDFKAGGSPERIQQDRRKMLLHRLFENRAQIAEGSIEKLIYVHVSEYFRLLNVTSAEQEKRRNEFLEAWPFAPALLKLLEEQVLVATDAQETRDLIRILANLFKNCGEKSCILTPSDFRVDIDESGIGTLLDSVANERHRRIREKAQHNITSIEDAVPEHNRKIPHLREIISALWLRSIAVENYAGAEPQTLQSDVTREKTIDDNAFQSELAVISENSFNIHHDGPKLIFREEENPQAKLLAYARNDKYFDDGRDLRRLAKEIRYILGGEVASTHRIIVLPKIWRTDPWSNLDESDRSENWEDRFPILVLPEEPGNLDETLGKWLKDHLTKRRNTVRFLLPAKDSGNIFLDKDLLILARAEYQADEWRKESSGYRDLFSKYQKELREKLKKRFDRFAILLRWNFSNPSQCEFSVEHIANGGTQPIESIEKKIGTDLFVAEDFEELVSETAKNNGSVGKLLAELREPRPSEYDCIPWLGETDVKERILKICAKGDIAIDLRGLETLQQKPGEDYDAAWTRMKSKLPMNGHQLDEVILMEPSSVPSTGGVTLPPIGGNNDPQPGSRGIGGTPPVPPAVNPPIGGGVVPPVPPVTKTRIPLNNPPTSPLNLIGKMEEWNIGPATTVREISIRVSDANGAQLKELLKKLPDGMTFSLSLEKEEN